MASRQRTRLLLSRAAELVMEEGSDIGEDSDGGSEENDELIHSDVEYVPMNDDMDESDRDVPARDSDTDSDSSRDRPRPTTTSVEKPAEQADGVMHVDDEDDAWKSDWTHSLTSYPITAPFTGTPGLHLPPNFPATPTAVNFYKLFMTRDVVKSFKVETNRYAASVCAKKRAAEARLSPRSIYLTWSPVTVDEMTKFLSILIHMGLVKKPQIDDYWSTHSALSTPFASRLLMRSRFKSILAFFHLNDNQNFIPKGQPNHDPLFKLRPFFDHLVRTFQELYTPDEAICNDEAAHPWRGQSVFRCYMKDKPTTWGLKLYKLCESSTGYVCNLEVMCHTPELSNKPFDVCLRLLQPFTNSGYALYMDSSYCKPQLAEVPLAENTLVVGTVRADRNGLPEDPAQKQMVHGEMDHRRKNQVLYVHLKDERDVHMSTTKHLPEVMTVGSRTEEKRKPACVVDYISNAAGVDKSDQLTSYLLLHRKTVKWWKKLAFHLLTLVMIQAHVLFNRYQQQHQRKGVSLEDFVKLVCVDFGSAPERDEEDSGPSAGVGRAIGAAAAAPPPVTLSRLRPGNHYPEDMPAKPEAKRRTQRSCKVCYERMKYAGATRRELKNRTKATTYQCGQCKVPLCVSPCFRLFHTVEHYHKATE